MPGTTFPNNFSLFNGGSLDRLEHAGRILRGDKHDLFRHWALALLIGWIPVVVLSLAVPIGGLHSELLSHLDFHTRWLLAVPALFIGESRIGRRIGSALEHLVSTGIVRETESLDRAMHRVERLRDSGLIELALLTISSALALPAILQPLSAAELWYHAISLTLFRFLLLRYVFRWLLWSFLLLKISRMNLHLTGGHPDKSGGLAILSLASRDFGPVAFAISAVNAAAWWAPIASGRASFTEFLNPIGGIVLIVFAVALGPLTLLIPVIRRAREQSIPEYATLAARYSDAFQSKWIDGPPEDPLGTADIQSFADLGTVFERVSTMRLVPVDRQTILYLVIALLLPNVPLYLMSVPLNQVLKKVIGMEA